MKTVTYVGKIFEVVPVDSALGRKLNTRCGNYLGRTLNQVYDTWSVKKQTIYDNWWRRYCDDSKSDMFSIVSKNCHYFSLGWFTTLDNAPLEGYLPDVSVLITPTHNYIIAYRD